MFKQPPPAPTARVVGPCPSLIQISRTPRHWKFTQHHRTTRPTPVGLKPLNMQQGLSEPEFNGDFVYKLRKIVCRADFTDQFRKVIIRGKRPGYNINVMRQSACLVINRIMIDNFASLLSCTLVGRASDSVMGPA